MGFPKNMLLVFAVLVELAVGEDINPVMVIDSLSQRWQKVHDCSGIMESWTYAGSRSQHQVIKYYFVKPGWIYMEITGGDGKGSRVFYDVQQNRVKVRAGGILGLMTLSFDPDNPEVKSIRGHRLPDNHLGYLISRWKYYLKNCRVWGRMKGKTIVLTAEGADTSLYYGTYKEVLVLDAATFFPIQFEQYDIVGNLIHKVVMSDFVVSSGISVEDLRKMFKK